MKQEYNGGCRTEGRGGGEGMIKRMSLSLESRSRKSTGGKENRGTEGHCGDRLSLLLLEEETP